MQQQQQQEKEKWLVIYRPWGVWLLVLLLVGGGTVPITFAAQGLLYLFLLPSVR